MSRRSPIHDFPVVKLLAACALATLIVGCAAPLPEAKLVDVAEERTDRKDTVVRDFESRRNQAQYDAAIMSWERGDRKACEEGLRQILARRPEHVDARLLLADLYVEQGRSEAALEELHSVLQRRPNQPRAHFATALLHESLGRADAALPHYRKALEGEPGNSLYRLSMETCEAMLK